MSYLAEISPVLQEVLEERRHQDNKWGEQNHEDGRWCLILAEEVGEAAQAALMQPEWPPEHLRQELLQVAAVAVAWIEAMDRRAAHASS